jgi:hypothetical protein
MILRHRGRSDDEQVDVRILVPAPCARRIGTPTETSSVARADARTDLMRARPLLGKLLLRHDIRYLEAATA